MIWIHPFVIFWVKKKNKASWPLEKIKKSSFTIGKE